MSFHQYVPTPMKTLVVFLFSLLAASTHCTAQVPALLDPESGYKHCHPASLCSQSHHTEALLQAGRPTAIVRRPYDVLSYDIELDWRTALSTTATTGAARQYKGVNTMRIRIDSANVTAIELDAANLQIDRILLDDSEIAAIQPSGSILTIPLGTAPEPGHELTLRIEYVHMNGQNAGFHLYAKGSQSGAVVERIAYTLGAPDYTRYWLPCNDNAYDKATVRLTVVVPQGYTTACNGLPNPPVDNGDGSFSHVWNDTTQIATYLIVAHASVYRHFADEYERKDGEKIPLLYYVWEEDYEGTMYNAKEKFAPVPDMMRHFSERFGEYPFSKYGMAVAMPFTYFAMENQTMTTLVRAAINDEPTIAHELSHQWLGDFVSPATWNDVWMNEGGATYSEALWAESESVEQYRTALADKRGIYLSGNMDGTKQPPCYRELDGNPIGSNIYNYAITYAKGAWVYHMLRQLTGDKVFFHMLRSFLSEHAYGVAETEDMIMSFEQYIETNHVELPVSIRTFFDEWVYKKGHPVYQATAAVGQDGNAFAATVLLKQTQPTQVFTMPVEIAFTGANSEKAIRTIFLDQREKQETFELPFLPVSIGVDPDANILCVVEPTVVTGIDEGHQETGSLQVYPNPATGGIVQMSVTLPAPASGSVEVYNAVGERVAVVFAGMFPAGTYLATWDAGTFPTGTYVVRANTGTKSILRKVCIAR